MQCAQVILADDSEATLQGNAGLPRAIASPQGGGNHRQVPKGERCTVPAHTFHSCHLFPKLQKKVKKSQ